MKGCIINLSSNRNLIQRAASHLVAKHRSWDLKWLDSLDQVTVTIIYDDNLYILLKMSEYINANIFFNYKYSMRSMHIMFVELLHVHVYLLKRGKMEIAKIHFFNGCVLKLLFTYVKLPTCRKSFQKD